MRDSKDMTVEELKTEIKALGASKERMEKAVVSMAEGRRLKRARQQDRARRAHTVVRGSGNGSKDNGIPEA
jgi:hypothetical protein